MYQNKPSIKQTQPKNMFGVAQRSFWSTNQILLNSNTWNTLWETCLEKIGFVSFPFPISWSATTQKMKFSMKFSISITADLVTFTGEILNGKLHFLCSVRYSFYVTFMIHFTTKTYMFKPPFSSSLANFVMKIRQIFWVSYSFK